MVRTLWCLTSPYSLLSWRTGCPFAQEWPLTREEASVHGSSSKAHHSHYITFNVTGTPATATSGPALTSLSSCMIFPGPTLVPVWLFQKGKEDSWAYLSKLSAKKRCDQNRKVLEAWSNLKRESGSQRFELLCFSQRKLQPLASWLWAPCAGWFWANYTYSSLDPQGAHSPGKKTAINECSTIITSMGKGCTDAGGNTRRDESELPRCFLL